MQQLLLFSTADDTIRIIKLLFIATSPRHFAYILFTKIRRNVIEKVLCVTQFCCKFDTANLLNGFVRADAAGDPEKPPKL